MDNSQKVSRPVHKKLTAKELGYISSIAQGRTRRQAVKDNYDVKQGVKPRTLDNMASAIEKRPMVLALLNEHEREAQESVLDVMRYSKEHGRSGTKDGAQYARVALDGANSLLDRVHGKAKQQIEVQSTTLAISIDLTGQDDTSTS